MSDLNALTDRLTIEADYYWQGGGQGELVGILLDAAAALRHAEVMRAAIRKHHDAGIDSNCGETSCDRGCGNDLELWSVLVQVADR